MREIGISPRFSRDKFVPLQTKQRYSTRDISGEVSLTLFFRGFVPFLSLADFVSRNKNLQVADLQRLKSCFGELVTATTSNHQDGACAAGGPGCHHGERQHVSGKHAGRNHEGDEQAGGHPEKHSRDRTLFQGGRIRIDVRSGHFLRYHHHPSEGLGRAEGERTHVRRCGGPSQCTVLRCEGGTDIQLPAGYDSGLWYG